MPDKDKIITALKEKLWRHLHAEASSHGADNDKARNYANNQIETIIKKAGES